MGAGAYSRRYCQFSPRVAGFSSIRSGIWWIDTWYDHIWWEGKNFFFLERVSKRHLNWVWYRQSIAGSHSHAPSRCSSANWANKPIGRQLVERCTGTAEVKGSNLVQAWIFFRLSFCSCKSCVYYCGDLLSYYSSPLSSHIWFWHIHNFSFIFVKWKKKVFICHTIWMALLVFIYYFGGARS